MIFKNSQSIFFDRLGLDCLLSDNKFVKIYNFLLLNNYVISKKFSNKNDIIILDLCGLKKSYLDFSDQKIKEYIDKGKHIILIGCISNIIKEKYGDKIIYVDTVSYKDIELYFEHKIGISDIEKINNDKKINQLHTGNHYTNGGSNYLFDLIKSIHFLNKKRVNNMEITKDFIKKSFFSKLLIIEISTGCQFKCSYCNIKKIKGNTKSLLLSEILEEIKKEIKKGKKDIFLLSDDCGSYGVDIGTNFGELVKSILELDHKLKIYISNIHPTYLMKFYEGIKKYIYANRIPYILVPIQHSSIRILKLMNRIYNLEKLINVLIDIKEKSNTKLNNQIMFNYHGETLKEFLLTYKYLRYYDKTFYVKFSDINNQFGEDFISYDYEKKISLLQKIQKKLDIDINTTYSINNINM